MTALETGNGHVVKDGFRDNLHLVVGKHLQGLPEILTKLSAPYEELSRLARLVCDLPEV